MSKSLDMIEILSITKLSAVVTSLTKAKPNYDNVTHQFKDYKPIGHRKLQKAKFKYRESMQYSLIRRKIILPAIILSAKKVKSGSWSSGPYRWSDPCLSQRNTFTPFYYTMYTSLLLRILYSLNIYRSLTVTGD